LLLRFSRVRHPDPASDQRPALRVLGRPGFGGPMTARTTAPNPMRVAMLHATAATGGSKATITTGPTTRTRRLPPTKITKKSVTPRLTALTSSLAWGYIWECPTRNPQSMHTCRPKDRAEPSENECRPPIVSGGPTGGRHFHTDFGGRGVTRSLLVVARASGPTSDSPTEPSAAGRASLHTWQ